MKKILINENTAAAELFIKELENKLLPAFQKIFQDISGFGITPDKKLLLQVSVGNLEALRSKFWEVCQGDIDVLKSPVSKAALRTDLEAALQVFIESIPILFASEIDGRPINNSFFEKFVSYDEKEGPFLSDFTREQIRENYKQYLEDERLIKVFESHAAAAKALQKFVDEFSKSNLAQAQFMRINPGQRILGLFKVEIQKNDKISIIPAEIDYNLQSDPEIGEFPPSSTTYTPQIKEDIQVTRGKQVPSRFLKNRTL